MKPTRLAIALFLLVVTSMTLAREYPSSIRDKPLGHPLQPELKHRDDENRFRNNKDIKKLYRSNQQLERKVQYLEKTIADMQKTLLELQARERHEVAYVKDRKQYSCLLSTHGRGSFIGKANTRIEAKGRALQQCEAKLSAIFCSSKIECERER